jgi:hypothetical protein
MVEACAVALRLGAHGLDLDVAMMAGQVCFVQPNRGGFADKFRRGGTANPTVSNFFAALPGALDVPVFVRVRGEDVAEMIAALTAGDTMPKTSFIVASARGVPQPSPGSSVSCYVRSALAEMPHGPERFFAGVRAAGWRGAVMPDRDWTGGVVALAHRFELEAIADVVVQEHRALELLRMGIDVISSLWPDRLASAALEFERTRPTGA